MGRCMLEDAGLEKSFGQKQSIQRPIYKTVCQQEIKRKTPFEIWNNDMPNLSHLIVFRATAYAYLAVQKKFNKKVQKIIFKTIF